MGGQVITTWGAWKSERPGTTVLSLDTGYERDYEPGKPYGEYFASPDTIFPAGPTNDILPRKAWVFGIELNGSWIAFALDALQRVGVVNTDVAGSPMVIVAGGGRAVRAYDRPAGLMFERTGEGMQSSDGALWQLTDLGLLEKRSVSDARRLVRLPGHLAYWFGWYGFFPDTELWVGDTE